MTDIIDASKPLSQRLAKLHAPGDVFVVGLTGSVASGKSTLARQVTEQLADKLSVDMASTDGFLFPTAVLEERDLMHRKGFPESYDTASMAAAIESLRSGEATFPAYSHITFDIDPSGARTLPAPDIMILEGLGFTAPSPPPRKIDQPDVLIYLDAKLEDLERWYLDRFLRFWRAAEDDRTSFYAQFLHMTEPELIAFAKSVWAGINLPNLENHILPLRDTADIVVKKDASHRIEIMEDRTA
jgi:type I pantothenate kinase